MKKVMLIIDGMPDGPLETVQSAFANPVLHSVFLRSDYGWFDTVPEGMEADSLICIPTLLGVSPHAIPNGRAYLECVAHGLNTPPDGLFLRCNPVFLCDEKLVSANCSELSENELAAASAQFQGEEGLRIEHLRSYKNILMLEGMREGIDALKTSPPHQNLGSSYESLLPMGGRAGARLREFCLYSREVLTSLFKRDMSMIPWGQATACELPGFVDLFGYRAGVVCETEIVKGLASLMGMHVFTGRRLTAETDTDLSEKLKLARESIETYDFTLVHVNGADEAAHRRNSEEKAAFVAKVFEQLLMPLAESIPADAALLACSDHASSPFSGGHIGSPQPFFVFRPGRRSHADLGLLPGTEAVRVMGV